MVIMDKMAEKLDKFVKLGDIVVLTQSKVHLADAYKTNEDHSQHDYPNSQDRECKRTSKDQKEIENSII